ncbi:MAG: PAS domain-containing sensor histidine kinase, partial [Maribacter sp.]|nr:PAS domain-containing sensor histidine kinase [Maribacter sp.]
GLVGTFQDINEQELINRKTNENELLLRTLIDSLPLNVFVKDLDSRKILVNKSELDFLGLKHESEALGKTDFDFLNKKNALIGREEDIMVMENGIPLLKKETTNIKKDGTKTSFLTSKIPLKGANGKITGLVGISLDISDLKNKEEELRNLINVTSLQNKKLVNFAHIVSHNLRSHTANFSMLLEFLVSEKDEEEKQNLINMLVEASDHLLETLNNLNEVVVINTNVNLKKQNISLIKNIQSVEKNLSVFLKNNNAKVINTIEADVKIKAIPAYLDSILMNFFTNAIMYKSPERDPVIKLSSTRENGYTILSITDNGLGIDLKKYGDKLFGMYKTFHNNADAKGIGLFLTKNQVEAMNGKITTSSVVGKGTTFNIHFNEDN